MPCTLVAALLRAAVWRLSTRLKLVAQLLVHLPRNLLTRGRKRVNPVRLQMLRFVSDLNAPVHPQVLAMRRARRDLLARNHRAVRMDVAINHWRLRVRRPFARDLNEFAVDLDVPFTHSCSPPTESANST